MTKHRPPLDVSAALARHAGHFPGGYDDLARHLGKTASLVRKWGDPSRREAISIDHAIALDLHFQDQGGVGAPIYECYTAQLGLRGVDRFALPMTLGRILPEVMKENSDAEIALARVSQPGANDADLRSTLREADEAIAKWQQVRTLLVQHQHDPPTGG